MASTPSARTPEIDGLRALAVSLVFIHHAVAEPVRERIAAHSQVLGNVLSSATSSGVELFFVLSAVLLLAPAMEAPRHFRTIAFGRRRATRLWPPYALALVFAGLIVIAAQHHPTWYSTTVLPKFTFWSWIRQAGIVNFGWVTYNGAWWSLTIEICFYATIPLVVVAVLQRARLASRRSWLVVGSAALAASFVAAQLVHPGPTPGPRDVLLTFLMYSPCFAIGACLMTKRHGRSTGRWVLGLGLALVVLSGYWHGINAHAGFALFYGGLFNTQVQHAGAMSRLLSTRAARWVGERSYSMFLVHFSALYVGDYLASLHFATRSVGYFAFARLIGIPLTIVTTLAVFELAERPYARGLSTSSPRPVMLRRIRNAEAT